MNAPRTVTVRRAQAHLGTLVSVEAAGLPAPALHRAVDLALRAVARVHAGMSFHDPASELSRLNGQAHAAPMVVSGHLWRVLRAACRVSALTGGCFDVTVAPALVRFGLLPRVPGPTRAGTWQDIRLSPGRTVHFARPVLVDLGGIAKGYAVDLAIAALRRAGVTEACVNAGGDLRFFGTQPRAIAIRDPLHADRAHLLPARTAGAVATSCVRDTRRRHARGWRSPLVHPASSRALGSGDSVTVLARTCLLADALTKPAALDAAAATLALRRLGATALRLPAP